MSSEFGEKLARAIADRENDINVFVWKGQKEVDTTGKFKQSEIRLVTATDEQLKQFHSHCKTMLFNEDRRKPGRITLLNEIADQRNRCGVELFYRDSRSKNATSFAIVDGLKSTIANTQLNQYEVESLKLGDIITISSDFSSLPVQLVIDGGLDKLGKFDRSHITLSFIARQGIWLSDEEKRELSQLPKPAKERIQIIKDSLKIPSNILLSFNPVTGLSIKEMKSILSLKSKRYSEMSTEQLTTLRYKLLFALEDQVNIHIAQWNERMRQIELVAKARGLKLS